MDAAGSDTDLFDMVVNAIIETAKKKDWFQLIRTGVFTEQELKTLTSHKTSEWRIEHSLTHILPSEIEGNTTIFKRKKQSNYRCTII
jgi:hypothetical protein